MVNFKVGNVRRFFVQSERPRLEDMTEVMEAHAHREIDPGSEVEVSVGWCGLWDDRVAGPIPLDAGIVGFGLRVDTLKVPGSVLKAKTRDACEAMKVELKLDILSRYQIDDVRARVKQDLRGKIPPKVTHVPVLWSEDEQDVVYLLTGSDTVAAQFCELFEKTFDIELISDGVYARLKSGELADDLEHYTNVPAFIRIGSSVHQEATPAGAPYLEHDAWWSRLGLAFLHHLAYMTTQDTVDVDGWDVQFIDGGRADLAREDTTVKFRKGSPLESTQLGNLLLEGSLLQSVGLELQRPGFAEDFKVVVTGRDLRLSGISLPSVLADEQEEYVIETCWLLNRLFRVIDALLEVFVMETSRLGLEGFDHLTEWAQEVARVKE